MFGKLFGVSSPISPSKKTVTQRDLLRQEAAIGGTLFGPVPSGRTRQFFCLDEHCWIWHETWVDAAGRQQHMTTRYEIRPNGVLKAQDNHPYHYVEDEERRNLFQAVKLYYQSVMNDVYGKQVTL